MPGCFVGSTLIDTARGRIQISNLADMAERGEALPLVFAFDRKNATNILLQIEGAWKAGQTSALVDVRTHRGQIVRCTPEHPFLTATGDYISASALSAGVRLRADDGLDPVESVTSLRPRTPETVFDLAVGDVNNFAIASSGVVHSILVQARKPK